MRDAAEMTCRKLVDLVTEYLEGTLPPADLARFHEHVEGCTGCRTYLEQMRQIIRSLGRLTEDEIPEEAKEELLKVFRDWKQAR